MTLLLLLRSEAAPPTSYTLPTTSLLIGYPQITVDALAVTPSVAFDEDRTHFNMFAGERWTMAQIDAAGVSFDIDFDLGTSNTATVEFLIIAGDSQLIADGCTSVLLKTATSAGGGWTNRLGCTTGYSSTTVLNSDNNDKLFIGGFNDNVDADIPTAGYRFWRLSMAAPSSAFPFSKATFGRWFDMGVEPDFDCPMTHEKPEGLEFPSGNLRMSKLEHPQYRVTLTWTGVSDATTASFFEEILDNAQARYVWLYTHTEHAVLNDKRLLHCKVIANECSAEHVFTDWNIITAVFEEAKG